VPQLRRLSFLNGPSPAALQNASALIQLAKGRLSGHRRTVRAPTQPTAQEHRMNRNFRLEPSRSAKFISALAAAAMTTVLLGSQLGLATHYADEGQALLAAAQAAKLAKGAASAAQSRRSS
jgi:hypothetical protein